MSRAVRVFVGGVDAYEWRDGIGTTRHRYR
jgi:alpha-L-arabinofuranosidase